MMKYILSVVFLGLGLLCKGQTNDTLIPYPMVEWVEQVVGDFSFKDTWSYKENVFKNESGQLICDGFCEDRLYEMRDKKTGRIPKDSLAVYYTLLDTTHYYHTLKSESSCSEFSDANYMEVFKTDSGYIYCHSLANVVTHCTIEILFDKKNIRVAAHLNSIIKGGDAEYRCFNGVLRVDEKEFTNGILKGEFYFTFIDTRNEHDAIYWRGLVYSPLKISSNK